ncbi:hypothetical protein DM619_12235 [Escherichia coli]|nr:hypothetical protein [Escherichia coli]EFO3890630.1 hypothetical protein [Escherichia coli]
MHIVDIFPVIYLLVEGLLPEAKHEFLIDYNSDINAVNIKAVPGVPVTSFLCRADTTVTALPAELINLVDE